MESVGLGFEVLQDGQGMGLTRPSRTACEAMRGRFSQRTQGVRSSSLAIWRQPSQVGHIGLGRSGGWRFRVMGCYRLVLG